MNDTPDWLDDVLQARPVDDDGFTARVGRLAGMQARTRLFRRVLALVVFALLVPGACTVFGLYGVAVVTRVTPFDIVELDASNHVTTAWLAENRAAFRALWTTLDANPGLVRSDGRDAMQQLEVVGCYENEPCETSQLVGLDGYERWTPSGAVASSMVHHAVDRHLARALEASQAAGTSTAFVAAATDVAHLGRLWMATSVGAFKVLRQLAYATDEARAAGVDGGFTPPLTAREVDQAMHASWLAWAQVTSASSVEDLGFLATSRSMLLCLVAADARWYERYRGYIDDDVLDRLATILPEECAPLEEPQPLCNESAPLICDVGVVVARLPPWRQVIAHVAAIGPERNHDVEYLLTERR